MRHSEMIERVARAILNASLQSAGRAVLWTDEPSDWPPEHSRDEARQCARAAIAAMREPSDGMLNATLGLIDTGDRGTHFDREEQATGIWQAMADAALADTEAANG